MGKANPCDVHAFRKGGPCIVLIDADDPEIGGYWFGEVVSVDVVIDDRGAFPRVAAVIKGGRFNRIGMPMPGYPATDPPGEYTVLPLTDTTVRLIAALLDAESRYANEVSSLRVSLDHAKADARAMEHMFTAAVAELHGSGTRRDPGAFRRRARRTRTAAGTGEVVPITRARRPVPSGNGCYSLVGGGKNQTDVL